MLVNTENEKEVITSIIHKMKREGSNKGGSPYRLKKGGESPRKMPEIAVIKKTG